MKGNSSSSVDYFLWHNSFISRGNVVSWSQVNILKAHNFLQPPLICHCRTLGALLDRNSLLINLKRTFSLVYCEICSDMKLLMIEKRMADLIYKLDVLLALTLESLLWIARTCIEVNYNLLESFILRAKKRKNIFFSIAN